MKSLLILFLAILSAVTFAATPNIHRPHRRVSTPHKTEIVVPWKTVAAGGAAAGTVLASYIRLFMMSLRCSAPEGLSDVLSVHRI